MWLQLSVSLIKICEDLRSALDLNKTAALLLMHLSKVFDYIPHDRMVQKVTAYGMTPEAVKLLISYVRYRQQMVTIGEHNSEWMTLLKGIPPGSILGPCLFNRFYK